jgi:transmembrane sensor
MDLEEQAAQAFLRRRFGPWTPADEAELDFALAKDLAYADAFRRVERSWAAVGKHATSAELMGLRESVIARARRAGAKRWRGLHSRSRGLQVAAALAALGLALAAAFQWAPFGFGPGEYRTRMGEQRTIELSDHSRIALDASTRVRVRFSKDARVVQLLSGQAQFFVGKDPTRPFKVEAGDHTVMAVGTVFTVEYVDEEMHVAMLEGRVAVFPQERTEESGSRVTRVEETLPKKGERSGPAQHEGQSPIIELVAGEELRVRHDGHATVVPKADLEAATAWREGKVIFHSEPLGEAVRRLNRYSSMQLRIDDPALASMNISGLFDIGDTAAFVEAVQAYLPVAVDSDSQTIHLRAK